MIYKSLLALNWSFKKFGFHMGSNIGLIFSVKHFILSIWKQSNLFAF